MHGRNARKPPRFALRGRCLALSPLPAWALHRDVALGQRPRAVDVTGGFSNGLCSLTSLSSGRASSGEHGTEGSASRGLPPGFCWGSWGRDRVRRAWLRVTQNRSAGTRVGRNFPKKRNKPPQPNPFGAKFTPFPWENRMGHPKAPLPREPSCPSLVSCPLLATAATARFPPC